MTDKHTSMNLVHYAAEFGCLKFFKSFLKMVGVNKCLKLFCAESRNGMNGFHFLAKNIDIDFYKYLTKNCIAMLDD